MKRTKKVLCIILSVILTAVIFAGCAKGSGKNNKEEKSDNSAEKKDKSAENRQNTGNKAAQKVNITWWGAWAEDAGPGEAVASFSEKYPNIEVEYIKFVNTDEGNVKLDTSLLSGADVHVFFNYGLKRIIPRADKGLAEILNPYMEKDNFNIEKELGDPRYTIDGNIYALPMGGGSSCTFINKKYLEDAGLPVPPDDWTIEDYADYAQKMTKGEGADKIYGSCDSHALNSWDKFALSVIGSDRWYGEDGLSNFNAPEFKTSLEYKYNMENIKKIQFPYLELKATKQFQQDIFLQGKAAMAISSNAMLRYLKNAENLPEGFEVIAAPVPNNNTGQKTNYLRGVRPFDYLAVGANNPQEEKDASWEFMKWISTEGNINMAKVAHIPSWKKVDKDEAFKIMLGDAADFCDVESFKKWVINYDEASYSDTNLTAYSQIYTICQEEAERVLVDEITVDEALSNMKKRSDTEIEKIK